VYALPIANYWRTSDKPSFGKMSGNGWLTQDDTQRNMLEYLKNSPEGVVLESVEQGAYSSSSALVLNAGKGVLLGWPDHVTQWRGSPNFVTQRSADIRAFYHAQLPTSLDWLRRCRVRYIIWSPADEQRSPGVRQQIHTLIEREYHWRPFDRNGEFEVGIWELRVPR
jgi:uncharacterized membrane protein